MQRTLILLAMMTILLASTARADDLFHPSRVWLSIYGGHDLSEKTHLEYQLIPAANLIGELAPLAYFGTKFKMTNWLDIGTYTGFAFKPNEPFVSFSFIPHFDKLYGWTRIDLCVPSQNGYYFAQAEYQIFPWLHSGIEGEGWGIYGKSASWTHGAGPNVLFRFGMIGIDMAVQIRNMNNETKPQFFLRTHLFL